MTVLQSLIPLLNDSTVLRADLHTRDDDTGEGVVLAVTPDNQYVTWRVYRGLGEEKWLATGGEYFDHDTHDRNLRDAIADYDERRTE